MAKEAILLGLVKDPNAGIVSGIAAHILLHLKIYIPILMMTAFVYEKNAIESAGAIDEWGIQVFLVALLLYLIVLAVELIIVCFFAILLLSCEAIAKQIVSMLLYEKAYYGGTKIDSSFAYIFSSKSYDAVERLNAQNQKSAEWLEKYMDRLKRKYKKE